LLRAELSDREAGEVRYRCDRLDSDCETASYSKRSTSPN
jgi:hypothetical protein